MTQNHSLGRSLELFFIDGKPDSMLTAEMYDWLGRILITPRTHIKEALKRPEAAHTGVYILLGENDGQDLNYIGEGEIIGARISSHVKNKDWWNTAVLIPSSANNLNKAHAKYLESRLIEEATAANRTALDNSATPALPGLSEADQMKMEVFLQNLFIVLPALRIDCFVKSTRTLEASSQDEGQTFELTAPKHGIHAMAQLENGEFVVLEGSVLRSGWEGRGSENSSYAKLYGQIAQMGILQEKDGNRVFSQNYAFKSPSAAASVVTGRAANGATEWKVKDPAKPTSSGRRLSYRADGIQPCSDLRPVSLHGSIS